MNEQALDSERNGWAWQRRRGRAMGWLGLLLAAFAPAATGSENVPHAPFAQWADLPERGQFVVGLTYEESEAYHIWAGGKIYNVDWKSGGEHYGIDINQGFFTVQYGLAARWALDLSVGYSTAGWRYFANDQGVQGHKESTTGLMDTSLGVRYQIFDEAKAESKWIPTLTFRAGAVLPGTYDQNFPFAPGLRSAAIEPEFLMRKHFGWTGFGLYSDLLYRWNRTTGNDQYIASVGFFQQIKGWELDVGYRHLQTLSGNDIVLYPDNSIYYPRDPRENSDTIEAGFSYTTSKHRIRYGFLTRTVVDGNNTDAKFWIGGSVAIPLGGKKEPKDTP